jgi:hypothetical protein
MLIDCLSCTNTITFTTVRALVADAFDLLHEGKVVGYRRDQAICSNCLPKFSSPADVFKLLSEIEEGKTVSIRFLKKDGSVRQMLCNKGDAASSYSRKENLFTKVVWDLEVKEYRSIPLDRVYKV